MQHYADGDLINEDTVVGYGPAGDEALAVWGPEGEHCESLVMPLELILSSAQVVPGVVMEVHVWCFNLANRTQGVMLQCYSLYSTKSVEAHGALSCTLLY